MCSHSYNYFHDQVTELQMMCQDQRHYEAHNDSVQARVMPGRFAARPRCERTSEVASVIGVILSCCYDLEPVIWYLDIAATHGWTSPMFS